jgi:hypothetical protein
MLQNGSSSTSCYYLDQARRPEVVADDHTVEWSGASTKRNRDTRMKIKSSSRIADLRKRV